jgi:hypothetical protein
VGASIATDHKTKAKKTTEKPLQRKQWMKAKKDRRIRRCKELGLPYTIREVSG